MGIEPANETIDRVEWGVLEGERPRFAGCNARLGEHGKRVRLPMARLTTTSGAFGVGFANLDRDRGEKLLGQRLPELFSETDGPLPTVRFVEYPLWDLIARLRGASVALLAWEMTERSKTGALPATSNDLRAPVYDTSLYFDDLHLERDEAACELMACEAQFGFDRGHRAFKMKVGRGARHMPIEAGLRRDIAVIHAVREAIGPDCRLMIDANNGYNLNLARQALSATAECKLFWLEEPFHEDPELYRILKEWMASEGVTTLVADGEGEASPSLVRWAERGLIDVVQYDILQPGFTRWLKIGPELDRIGVRSAPHHYGACYGNFVSAHLAGTIERFTFVEWDEVEMQGLDRSAYSVQDGCVAVPDRPGFGLELVPDQFDGAVKNGGFSLSLGETR